MAAGKPVFSVKLTADDVPGAKLRTAELNDHSVLELQRWLNCRGLSTSGDKRQLMKRCKACIDAGRDGKISITVDEGKWFAQKVQAVLQKAGSVPTDTHIPVLPVCDWKAFPSAPIPKAFCYGTIYRHIILTATVVKPETVGTGSEMELDFLRTEPVRKGRQFFLNGHVTDIMDHQKGNFYFVKARVLVSVSTNKHFNVSVTLDNLSAVIAGATCECISKLSTLERCGHVAALLFAIEDYTHQFGHSTISPSGKLRFWKKRRNPEPGYPQRNSKKTAQDCIASYSRCAPPVIKEADKYFINHFITTLSETGSETMFGHLLEIIYDDYEVDMGSLQRQVAWAMDLQSYDSDHSPLELPGTIGQSDCEEWYLSRASKVTACIAKDIAYAKTKECLFDILKRNLWRRGNFETLSISYAKNHKFDAFVSYQPQAGEYLSKSGFWINASYPCLGCSPDGILKNDKGTVIGILAIKCPYVLRKISPLDLKELKPCQLKKLCYTVSKGCVGLRPKHKYMYEVQMQMAVCSVEFCDLIIWSPKGSCVERIPRNREFWDSFHPKLEKFYKNILLPEYFEMRVPRRLLPILLDEA